VLEKYENVIVKFRLTDFMCSKFIKFILSSSSKRLCLLCYDWSLTKTQQ